MNQTLDMTCIRYLNLFSKISGVRCKNCFFYNSSIVFAVPSALVSKAIGRQGKNVKELASILGKKIKVVVLPFNIGDAKKFISSIVSPIEFKNLEITKDEIVITANKQSKAGLIGRNKRRFLELQKIIKEFFGKGLRIV